MNTDPFDETLRKDFQAPDLPPCPPGFDTLVMNRIVVATAGHSAQPAARANWVLPVTGLIGVLGFEAGTFVQGSADMGWALLISDRLRSLTAMPDFSISQDFAFLGLFTLAALVGLWRLLPAPAAQS